MQIGRACTSVGHPVDKGLYGIQMELKKHGKREKQGKIPFALRKVQFVIPLIQKVLQLIWGLWKWILGSFQILYIYGGIELYYRYLIISPMR